jgi:hypothetical protein
MNPLSPKEYLTYPKPENLKEVQLYSKLLTEFVLLPKEQIDLGISKYFILHIPSLSLALRLQDGKGVLVQYGVPYIFIPHKTYTLGEMLNSDLDAVRVSFRKAENSDHGYAIAKPLRKIEGMSIL